MSEETTKGFWDEAEVIYAYTRAQAIEDGVLVDVSEIAEEAGNQVPGGHHLHGVGEIR